MYDDPSMMPKERRSREDFRGGRRSSQSSRETFDNPFGSPYVPNSFSSVIPRGGPSTSTFSPRYGSPQNHWQPGSTRGPSPKYSNPRLFTPPGQQFSPNSGQRFNSGSAQRFSSTPGQRFVNSPQQRYSFQRSPSWSSTPGSGNRSYQESPVGFQHAKWQKKYKSRTTDFEDNHFDVNDYVLSEMTADPWAKLKSKYFEESRQQGSDHSSS